MFWGVNGAMLFPGTEFECHSLKYALIPFNRRTVKKGKLDYELEVIELDDVGKRSGEILSSSKLTELQSAKLLFGNADVLTTRLRPNLGKTILNDPSRMLAGTTEWIPLKLNHHRLHPLLVKWYLLSPRYVDHAERLLSGKEHPRVDDLDIFSLRVPYPSRNAQERMVQAISAIETSISMSRVSLREPADIINEILCADFCYPLKEHRERVRLHYFTASLHKMMDGFTLRSSAKFHHPAFELTNEFFSRTPHEKVKAFVAIPIRLGATAIKGDFVEVGEAYYVHPGATKHQDLISPDDCHQITAEFYSHNQRRFGLRPGDVVMNRSGEALGKVAMWDSVEPAIASDFTMRIRFDQRRMNPYFAWYFFRSVMFQDQVRRELRGSSLPNIFPPEVGRMLIVKCEKQRQDGLVKAIACELKRRKDALISIEAKHQEIAQLIHGGNCRGLSK